jgi:PAS domain S-box-containing protein
MNLSRSTTLAAHADLILQTCPAAFALSRWKDGRFVLANKASLKLHGYTQKEVIGSSSAELQLWNDPAKRKRVMAALRRTDKAINFVHEYRCKSGRVGRGVATLRKILLKGEYHVLGFLTDITELEKRETALLQTRNVLHALFDHATRGYAHCSVIFDGRKARDLVLLQVNRVFRQLFGRNNVAGAGIAALPPELAPQLVAICGRVARGKTSARFEIELQRPPRWLELSVFCPRRGDCVIVADDITHRKQSELALHLSEMRLKLALGVTGLLVFHQDRALRYTWIANPALGFDDKDLIGSTDAELLGARAAAPLTCIKRGVLRSGRGVRKEVWVTRAGQSGCFDMIVEPRRAANGRIVGIIGAAADITGRNIAENALQASRRELQALAAHQQDAIETERREVARDIHDALGWALTGIHMQLRQFTRMQAQTYKPSLAKLRVIRDMLSDAMAATRRITARLRPAALDDLGLAETCRWHLRQWSKSSGVRGVGRFEPLPVDFDKKAATDLFRILKELLNNVGRHARATRVDVRLWKKQRKVSLRVADNGRGMSAGETSGYGLAGVRERAARNGGAVTVKTGAHGTMVTVTFRCAF